MIKTLKFIHNVFMDPDGNFEVKLDMDGNYRMFVEAKYTGYTTKEDIKKQVAPEDCKKIRELIDECALWTWHNSYQPEGYEVLDGFSWELVYEDSGEIIGYNGNVIKVEGSNAYPWCFYKLIRAIIIAVPELKYELEEYAVEKVPVYE